MSTQDFQEIGHSGGRITFRVVTTLEGQRSYQVSWRHQRPVPTVVFAVYALPQGVAVASLGMSGVNQEWSRPPVPGCYPVFISSDSTGKFGHQCPDCQGYWRADASAWICPYCGLHGAGHEFLSEAQKRYVEQYCLVLRDALHSSVDEEYTIDMDTVAEAVGNQVDKPPFYYSDETQQKKYDCSRCGCFNDILGKFGYCSACGTRNELQLLKDELTPAVRARINKGEGAEGCVKEIASVFDSLLS